MPAPTTLPLPWADDATWTSGTRTGEATKIEPPAGVAEQGHVGDAPFRGEYANFLLHNNYEWLEFLRGEVGLDLFGDGSDGDVVIGAGTTTLTRDMYYNDLTLGASSIIACAGFRIFVRGVLTIASGGYIHNNGNAGLIPVDNATPGVAGAATAAGSLGASFAGGAGGASSNGTAGTAATASIGGAGGAGGTAAIGRTGGAGGTVTRPIYGYRHLSAALGRLPDLLLRGGAGGGGGAGGTDGSGTGGGGGSGGGPVVVWAFAAAIEGAGAIRSDGGVGGPAFAGPDATENGGGGGGGGGGVYLVSRYRTGAGTIRASGGAAGAGSAGGSPSAPNNGVAGSAGLTWEFVA